METIATTYHPDLESGGAYVFHHPPKFMWSSPKEVRRSWKTYAFYLHVPFCRKICTFCTFERKPLQAGALDWFVDNLHRELDIIAEKDNFSGAELAAVYLGGGTASLLSNHQIGRLLARLRSEFGLHEDAEITLECEPGTKSEASFAELLQVGVNRVSIGVQSFSESLLTSLNRAHTAADSLKMVDDSRRAGFQNVHVDLLMGIPGQTFDDWRKAIEQIIQLEVDHVSTYPLIIFEDQLLARQIRKRLSPPRCADNEMERMRLFALDSLCSIGFHRYSVTEYCKTNKECKYVRGSWDGSDYMGVGPGAYSRKQHDLWENTVLHSEYERLIGSKRQPLGKGTAMSSRQMLERDTAMGLCLLKVDIPMLESRSQLSVVETFNVQIQELVEFGLLYHTDNELGLTEAGVRYATHVMKSFLS